jgi:hypothetical protein
MFDIDTLNAIKKEERGELREQKSAILSKKISPAQKQQQWNAVCFPVHSTDDSYLLGLVF